MRDQEHTSALTLLFDCPRFGPLTHRACLRRQTERQELAVTVREARVVHGREVAAKKATKLGPPVREYCASGACLAGRAVRAEHADTLVEPCSACGAALFGGETCAMCANRAAEAKGKPVAKADQPRLRGPVSTVIWTEKQPDVPFVPPSEQRKAVDAIAPRATSADDELEDLEDEEPASVEGEKQAVPEVVHTETAAAQREDRRSGRVVEPSAEVVHPRGRARDLTGEHIGELSVLGRGKLHHTPNGTAKQYWRCRCDCGAEVEVDGGCLVREGHGSTRRCVACGQRRAAEAGRAASTRLPNGQTQAEFAAAHGLTVATVHKQLGLPMSASRRPRATPATLPEQTTSAADPPRAAHAEPPAPPPAKENAMPVTMSDRTCAVARCTEFLATTNKTGVCGPHQRRYGSAAKALAAGNAAAPVKRAQKSKAPELVVEGPASPPAIDLEPVASPGPDLAALSLEELLILRRSVEAQLRARRDRARDEASRIERELGADAGRAEAA